MCLLYYYGLQWKLRAHPFVARHTFHSTFYTFQTTQRRPIVGVVLISDLKQFTILNFRLTAFLEVRYDSYQAYSDEKGFWLWNSTYSTNQKSCVSISVVYSEGLSGGEHGEDPEEEAGSGGEGFRFHKHGQENISD